MNAEEFKKTIRLDLRRYGRSGFLPVYLLHPGFRYTFWLRFSMYLRGRRRLLILSKCVTLVLLRLSIKTGIQINPGATIGAGLYIPHFGGIVVNPSTVIGRNCYLSHNVLIGKVHSGKRKGVPAIGDDVFIGTGAVLLGNIKIGDNAAIGVNSVVIDDVPNNVLVGGAPARVVAQRGAKEILGI